ncbi:MAG: RDD family protein [Elusimicrobia bacterium]|nr:RDD family protein [Elusimicrobiota bacterium]
MTDKPVIISEAPEPQPAADAQRPAGFWIRSGAFTIDMLLAKIILFTLMFMQAEIAYMFTAAGIVTFIFPMFIWKGQTLGKRTARIIVAGNNGEQLNSTRIFKRYVFSHMPPILFLAFHTSQFFSCPPDYFLYILGVILFLCYIPAAFHNKRSLPDYITGTRVVYTHNIGSLRKVIVICAGVLGVTVFILLSLQALLEFIGRYLVH